MSYLNFGRYKRENVYLKLAIAQYKGNDPKLDSSKLFIF